MLFIDVIIPCRIRYDMKKFAALGRLLARIVGVDVGVSTICWTVVVRPDETVMTKKS